MFTQFVGCRRHRNLCVATFCVFATFLISSNGHTMMPFENPLFEGMPVDRCLRFAEDCSDTATIFCKLKGYTDSNDSQIIARSSTKTLQTKEICKSPPDRCDGFSYINCISDSTIAPASIINFEAYFRIGRDAPPWGNMRQTINEDQLGNTCGAMSLLIVNYYYSNHISHLTPEYVSYPNSVISAIRRLYDDLIAKHPNDVKHNTALKGEHLREIAKERWGYKTAQIRSSSVSPTVDASYAKLMQDLTYQNLVIALLRSTSPLVPKPQQTADWRYDHFVVVYSANDSYVKYVDPYVGSLKTITKTDFTKAWVGSRYYLAIKPT